MASEEIENSWETAVYYVVYGILFVIGIVVGLYIRGVL